MAFNLTLGGAGGWKPREKERARKQYSIAAEPGRRRYKDAEPGRRRYKIAEPGRRRCKIAEPGRRRYKAPDEPHDMGSR